MDAMEGKDPQKTIRADLVGEHSRNVDIGAQEDEPRGEKLA